MAKANVSEPVLAREIFDRLRQATANTPDVLTELCREYIFEARKAIVQMQEALARDDAGHLRERAHYLKGSSMMMGARELSSSCASLELMGRDCQLSAAPSELERAVIALKAIEAELMRELGAAVLPEEGTTA